MDMMKPTLATAELAPAGLPTLEDDGAAQVTDTISIGVSWDASSRGRSGLLGRFSRKTGADLDAVAVLFQDGEPVTLCAGFDENLMNPLHGQPGDGSVLHSGDNTTGKGDGDDEVITLHLDRIPAEFHRIVVMVAAFKDKNNAMGDQGFQGANNVLFTVYDGAGAEARREFCVRPSLVGMANCAIVAVLDRDKDDLGRPLVSWTMRRRREMVNVQHGNQLKLIQAAAAAR